MSKNYEDYKPLNPQPPRKRKNSALAFIKYAILVLLIIALAISAVFFVSTHKSEKGDIDKDTTPTLDITETTETTEPEETEKTEQTEDIPDVPAKPEIDLSAYTNTDMPKGAINKGALIFVSNNYKVVFPAADELVNINTAKTKSYKLSANNMKVHKDIVAPLNQMFDAFAAEMGKNDVILWTSYRDEARQNTVYNDTVKQYGEEVGNTLAAKGGESDHNTGLGVALRVNQNGKSVSITGVEGYGWIEENCYKFGFVERYPDNKIEKTGLNYSDSCYLRYVGVPVAEFMKKNDLCLEEFLTTVKDYKFGETHYGFVSEDGTAYEFYYVSGEVDGETVSVPVPNGKEYTVSGNNMDGFVVVAKK